jgi:hypothetical protein
MIFSCVWLLLTTTSKSVSGGRFGFRMRFETGGGFCLKISQNATANGRRNCFGKKGLGRLSQFSLRFINARVHVSGALCGCERVVRRG